MPYNPHYNLHESEREQHVMKRKAAAMVVVVVMTLALGMLQLCSAQSDDNFYRWGDDCITRLNCGDFPLNTYPYCNWSLPIPVRVEDLINRMTPDEMIAQMGHNAPKIERLGISCYNWWSESSHGIASRCGQNCPTSFPATAGLGATFNMPLIHRIGQAISDEARALWNEGISGLDYWAPNININRDPRWGRNQEVAGEDPYLTSQFVINYIRGMQEGSDPNYAKLIATCKHFAAYSLDSWQGISRHQYNAEVTDYDLVDTYLPAFKACVTEGRARSVMCSYNAINGIPACADPLFLQTILRDNYGFQGYVVSDCDAVDDIFTTHHYTTNEDDTCTVAVRAGCDLNCGNFYQTHLGDALDNNNLNEADLRNALNRMFTQLFAVGLFDPDWMQPYVTNITSDVVDSPEHSQLALEAARESIVLLKNEGNLLPLPRNYESYAVIGPNADIRQTLMSNYHGDRCHDGTFDCVMSPLEAVIAKVPDAAVHYAPGCNINDGYRGGFNEAMDAAQQSDVVIVFMGLDTSIEAEELDRNDLTLPGVQEDLLEQLATTGKPIVLVLINGGSLSIEWAKDNIPAIVETWYGGENGAAAIADVLFGDYNPGGRLPVTVYPADYVDAVSFADMAVRPSETTPGRTYRYYTGFPLWEFGYGLSYTTFSMAWVVQPPPVLQTNTPSFAFSVRVMNTGSLAGDQVVLVFLVRQTYTGDGGPLKRLFAFERVHLEPGQAQEVQFNSTLAPFMLPMGMGLREVVQPGTFSVEVGVMETEKIFSIVNMVGPAVVN